MSGAVKTAIRNPQSYFYHIRTALFHSTPVLERKRRTSWQSGSTNGYSKRYRRMGRKQEVLRNVNAFADNLFQSWHEEFCEDNPSSSKHSSWFKKQYCKGSKNVQNGFHTRRHWGRSRFEFCEDDEEFEIDRIFRSAFGGNQSFFWSFIDEEGPQRRRYTNNFRRFWDSRNRFEEEEDYYSQEEEEDGYSSTGSVNSDSKHRVALGLNPSGPLDIEQVKTAYRACALKWHPDRHQGSSKTAAEEKFKLCSAAYQSLCDKLAVN